MNIPSRPFITVEVVIFGFISFAIPSNVKYHLLSRNQGLFAYYRPEKISCDNSPLTRGTREIIPVPLWSSVAKVLKGVHENKVITDMVETWKDFERRVLLKIKKLKATGKYVSFMKFS